MSPQSSRLNHQVDTTAPPGETLKEVHFSDSYEVHEIETVDDMSSQEIDATWMSTNDLTAMDQDIRETVQDMERGLCESDVCLRGLESKTHAGANEREKMRMRGLVVVLEEQHRQMQRGRTDPERISIMYQHATGCCQAHANLLGLKDEMAAVKVANNNEYDDTIFCLDSTAGDDVSERKDDDDWTLHTTASSTSELAFTSPKTQVETPPITDFVISQQEAYSV